MTVTYDRYLRSRVSHVHPTSSIVDLTTVLPTDATLTTTDITTNNASTSKHGFFPKLPTAAGNFLKDNMTWGHDNHTLLGNVGTNTHAQIDTALTRLASTSGSNTGDQTLNSLLPAQTGKGGKFLKTDGTNASWDTYPFAYFVLKDADGVLWALSITTDGNLVTTSLGAAPAGTPAADPVSIKDADGVTWSISVTTDGNLETTAA